MVKAYRKADEIRQQRTNEEKWLQGLYIYHAICDCLPSMNAFKPKKPIEYMSRPFDFTEAERERTEKAQMENNIRKMTELMEQFNKQRKGVGVNGRTD